MVSSSGSSSSGVDSGGRRGKKRRKKLPVTAENRDSKKANGSPTAFNDEIGKHSSSSSSSSDSSSDSESDTESIISLPPALDGGWGWVVVVGSFFAHFLCDGLSYNAGVIYEHLHQTFHTGASETAWVSSVFLAVPYLLGPVAGAVTNRYGCRVATIIGAVIGFVGCGLSFFVDSLSMLCLTFGVIFGLGQALVLFASSVIVPYYFEERRSLAYGIAVSGSGIGTAVLAPLLSFLMHVYGWRGMMLILGGLSLNLAVCGALYRPLATREFKQLRRCKRNLEKFENRSKGSHDSDLPNVESSLSDNEHLEETSPHDEVTSLGKIQLNEDTHTSLIESQHSPTAYTRSCYVVGCDDVTFGFASAANVDASKVAAHESYHHRKRQLRNPREVQLVPLARQPSHTIPPLSRVDIFYRGSVMNQQNASATTAFNLATQKRIKRATSCPQLPHHEPEPDTWQDTILDIFSEAGLTIRQMASISILRRPSFLWFCLSNFLFYMWFEVPLNYLPEYTTKLTESEYSFVLIIIVGLVTTVGQIVFGYLCDKPWVSAVLLYGVGVSITGLSTLFLPLISHFNGLAVYTAIFTFGSCGNTALDTIILTQLLGIKRLTNSYGLLMVSQGLASLFGAPLAGHIIDMYDSSLKGYIACFFHAGSWLLLSGLMVVAITPFVGRLRHWNPCIESDDDDSDSEESMNHSLCNRDLEGGRLSTFALSHSPVDGRRAVSSDCLATAKGRSRYVFHVRKRGVSTSGDDYDCLQQQSSVAKVASQGEPNSSHTQLLESFPAKESEHSPLLANDRNLESNSHDRFPVPDQSDGTLGEANSTKETPPSTTYAKTAAGYAEQPGWSDVVYKDRSISVI